MRVVFFGTPEFAVPTLDALVGAGHEVLAVVAQPDRPKGRGRSMATPATVDRARALGVPARQPKAIKSGPFPEWFASCGADVAVVVAYGRILTPQLLGAPRLGCVNVHASLLPKYRGAAPVAWAIADGEEETGVVTMRMDEGMDTGPVYLERRTRIGPDETAGELALRLAPMGADLLTETLERLPGLEPRAQVGTPSHARPLERAHGEISWTEPALCIHDLVRAMNPWPVAWAPFRGDVLKVWKTRRIVDPHPPVSGGPPPGTVLEGARVACGEGAVDLLEVQLPGRRVQSGLDFVHGARISAGEVLA